jgi:hypothetical protein
VFMLAIELANKDQDRLLKKAKEVKWNDHLLVL